MFKFLPIILFVSHYAAGGTLIKAPPIDMGSMIECQIAKREIEKGFQIDAVEEYKVECLKGVDAVKRMEYNTQ